MSTEVRAVNVHVASVADGVALGSPPAAPRRKIVTIYKTVVLTADNPYDQLVNYNPHRHAFQITGGQAGAVLAANDVAVGSNQGDIQGLAGKAEPLVIPGKFIPAATLGYTSQEFHGANPVWVVALGAAPTYPMYIGVADHVYAED